MSEGREMMDIIKNLWSEPDGVMTVRELQSMLGLHEPKGLTIAGLTPTKPVHPARLLAELAE